MRALMRYLQRGNAVIQPFILRIHPGFNHLFFVFFDGKGMPA